MYAPLPKRCNDGVVKAYGAWEFCHTTVGKTYDESKAFCEGNGLELVEPKALDYAEAVNEVCGQIGGINCTRVEMSCDGSEMCIQSDWGWKWNSDSTRIGFLNFFSPD